MTAAHHLELPTRMKSATVVGDPHEPDDTKLGCSPSPTACTMVVLATSSSTWPQTINGSPPPPLCVPCIGSQLPPTRPTATSPITSRGRKPGSITILERPPTATPRVVPAHHNHNPGSNTVPERLPTVPPRTKPAHRCQRLQPRCLRCQNPAADLQNPPAPTTKMLTGNCLAGGRLYPLLLPLTEVGPCSLPPHTTTLPHGNVVTLAAGCSSSCISACRRPPQTARLSCGPFLLLWQLPRSHPQRPNAVPPTTPPATTSSSAPDSGLLTSAPSISSTPILHSIFDGPPLTSAMTHHVVVTVTRSVLRYATQATTAPISSSSTKSEHLDSNRSLDS